MKKKSLNFVIPCVVYPFKVMFSFGESDKELTQKLKKYKLVWEERMKLQGQGKCILLDTNNVVIRIDRIPKSPDSKGSLIHELFHAVSFIMWRIGMDLDIDKSSEAYAYLIGYLTTEIYKKL